MRKDIPSQYPSDLCGNYKYFHVCPAHTDAEGSQILPDADLYAISGAEMDDCAEEKRRKIHEFRDWLEPTGVVAANVIAIIALIVSIIALSV